MKRIYEKLLAEYLDYFPCVALIGARQCGKTTLMHTLGSTWRYFDMESGADYDGVSSDPDLFLSLYDSQVAIDEAQLVPELFPALRVAIDAKRSEKGRFIITGSSSPELLSSISESLAGRVGVIEMSPLLWTETVGRDSALIRRVAKGSFDPDVFSKEESPQSEQKAVHDYWFRGGYPEPWLKDDARFSEVWASQYTRTYLDRDISSLFPRLDQVRFRKFIQLLAGLSGQVINVATVARALGVSQPTARDYLDIAHGTFIWRKLPAFHHSSTKRLVKHPKGYLRDSGLLHHLLHVPTLEALLGHPQMGASWEGMVIEEILRQFAALGCEVDPSFYRTSAGAEVDLVCEGRFGLVPFEIKRAQRVDLRDLRGIRDFVTERNCPFGIVINCDTQVRHYTDRILGVQFNMI